MGLAPYMKLSGRRVLLVQREIGEVGEVVLQLKGVLRRAAHGYPHTVRAEELGRLDQALSNRVLVHTQVKRCFLRHATVSLVGLVRPHESPYVLRVCHDLAGSAQSNEVQVLVDLVPGDAVDSDELEVDLAQRNEAGEHFRLTIRCHFH